MYFPNPFKEILRMPLFRISTIRYALRSLAQFSTAVTLLVYLFFRFSSSKNALKFAALYHPSAEPD